MTEKNPDAASKLACPEEEIPMGMTPWSQLDEEARARVSRPCRRPEKPGPRHSVCGPGTGARPAARGPHPHARRRGRAG